MKRLNAQGVAIKAQLKNAEICTVRVASCVSMHKDEEKYNHEHGVRDGKQSETIIVFNHARQLLHNDEFLEKYFRILGKQDEKVVTNTPINHQVKDTSRNGQNRPVNRSRLLNCIG